MGDVHAVRSILLAIVRGAGATVACLGPNAVGKSTPIDMVRGSPLRSGKRRQRGGAAASRIRTIGSIANQTKPVLLAPHASP
jgi:ABC-type branched-subunit amino acid transport system ATPase component